MAADVRKCRGESAGDGAVPITMHPVGGRYIRRVAVLPSTSVLVRAWFGDDGAWESLVSEVQTPSEEGPWQTSPS